MNSPVLALGLCLLFAFQAGAEAHASSFLLENARGQNQAWSGVGRFSGAATCTAFLVETAGSGPAYALTAGHCVDRDPQQVLLARPGTGRVTFNYFSDTTDRQVTASVRMFAYSTMKGTDLAVLELDRTLGELAAQGIRSLRIAPSAPREGDRVVNVGIPVTGIPTGEAFVRRAACVLGNPADLVEFNWHWWGMPRNDCPDIKGGSSGSPLLLEREGSVIGVVGTSTAGSAAGGGFDCYLNRPCEIVRGGHLVEEDTSYSAPVAGLGGCFDAGGRFDVNQAGCPLDRGRQLRINRPVQRMLRPPASWQASLSGDALPYYRYTTYRAGGGDCRNLEGYGPPRRLAEANRIDDPVGAQDGIYYLCVIGGDGPQADANWQDPRHATVALVVIDSAPPVEQVRYQLSPAEGGYRLSFEFAPPDLSSYSYKAGTPETVNCADPSGYLTYRRVPISFRAGEQSLVCVKAEDEAGNFSAPLEIRLDGARILPLGIVSSASYRAGPVAPGQLVTLFGVNLTGEPVTVTDGAGVVRAARVLYSSPWQINLAVPPESALGRGRLSITEREWQTVEISRTAPGLFLAGHQGPGPASFLVRPGHTEPAFRCQDGYCALAPLDIGTETEDLSLEIYATGLRGAAGGVRARIGRQPVEVTAAGPQEGVAGLDRVIVRLPRPFMLRGYQPVIVEAGGRESNTVYVWLR